MEVSKFLDIYIKRQNKNVDLNVYFIPPEELKK